MFLLDWARSVRPSLLEFQQRTGVPALWAAAQFCHESDGGGGSLSGLAREAQNYAGLKWADWEAAYGCKPVTYGTWEVVDGQREDVSDAFCWCPSWEVWLQVYGDLLTGSHYSPALAYNADPLLYGSRVWSLGWATDPGYLVGVSYWMRQLWADYADTLVASAAGQAAAPAQQAAAPPAVTVARLDGSKLCDGWLENGRTVVPLRDLATALGLGVAWNEQTRTATIGK